MCKVHNFKVQDFQQMESIFVDNNQFMCYNVLTPKEGTGGDNGMTDEQLLSVITQTIKSVMEPRFDQIDARLDRLEERMDHQETQMAKLNERMDRLEERMDHQEAQMLELNSRMEKQETQMLELNSRMEKQETQMLELNSRMEKQEAQMLELNSRMDHQEAQMLELNGRMGQLESQMRNQEAQMLELNIQMERQRVKMEEIGERMGGQETRTSSLEEKLDEFRKESAKHTRMLVEEIQKIHSRQDSMAQKLEVIDLHVTSQENWNKYTAGKLDTYRADMNRRFEELSLQIAEGFTEAREHRTANTNSIHRIERYLSHTTDYEGFLPKEAAAL